MPKVNPELLRSARVTAGFSQREAATRLGIGAKDSSAKLEKYEKGEIPPSRALLQKMASVYRRNLLYFYLAAPPAHEPRTKDFRTAKEADIQEDQERILSVYIRGLEARQAILSDALVDAGKDEAVDFIGSLGASASSADIARSIQDVLGLSRDVLRRARGPEKSFQLLRDAAEKAHIFVVIERDLGSFHSEMSLGTFRGIALGDKYAPFVVINSEDARPAWSFTLLHEIAHLLIGESGISGPREASMPIERKCNEAASLFLLSDEELYQEVWPAFSDVEALKSAVGAFAKQRNLSRQMVAYRLYRVGLLNRAQWASLDSKITIEASQKRDKNRAQKGLPNKGGPDYRTVKAFRLGRGLVGVVSALHKEELLTTTKAAKVLGVKPANLAAISARALGQVRLR